MAVQWQTVDLPLATGINTRDDEKLLPPVKLLDLQNAVLTKGGALLKRNGSVDLSTATVATPTGTISEAVALATRGNELLLADGERLLSYSSAASAWADRGDLQCFGTTLDIVADSPDAQVTPDCATADGVTVFAWEVGTATYYAVYDAESGAAVQAPTLLALNSSRPRVVAVGDTVLVLFYDASAVDIRVKRIVASDLAASLASPLISFGYGDIHANTGLDAVAMGDLVVWVCKTTANTGRVGLLTATGSLSGHGYSSPVEFDAGNLSDFVISVDVDSTGAGVIVYKSTTGLRQKNITALSGTIATTAAGGLITATAVTNATCRTYNAFNTAHVWWEIAGASPYLDRVEYARCFNGTLQFNAATIRHASLASKAFDLDGEVRIHVHHSSALQGTYFMVDLEGNPIGRVLPGTAYGRDGLHLPTVTSPSTGAYEWAATFKHRLSGDDDSVYTQPGVSHVKYDLESQHGYCSVDRKGTLYVGGGLLWQYDGESPTESGFLLYPENVTAVKASGGSLTASSSYFYTFYWEWFNALGEREQSATGEILEVALAVGQTQVTFTIPTLTMTHKRGDRRDVCLAIYRSATNGTTRNRVTSLDPADEGLAANGYLSNDTLADTVTFVDRMSDVTAATKELDYLNQTTDVPAIGELPNIAPPALRALADVQGRLWGVSCEDRRRVYYTKLVKPDTAAEWTDTNYLELPREIVGVASVSGQPIFFAEDAIYYVNGDGPDNLGAGVYGRVEEVPCDVGLSAPRILARCPAGWVFLSRKGFWLLGNNLQVNYIGGDVSAWADQTFTGVASLQDVNQVRFLTSDAGGRTLVFDYERNAWYTFTRHEGVASIIWRGTYCYAQASGVVRSETPGVYRDSGNGIALSVTTAWFKPGESIQGFGRIKRILLLGKYKSVHTLRVEVDYDYEDIWRECYEITPSSFIETATWGSAATWGADTVWGGSGNTRVHQTRRGLPRQKCQAIRFRITEVPGIDAGEGLELNLLTLVVGRKSGANRLPENRTI